jgi:hypothetical protein
MAQAILDFDTHPGDRATAFELGWDHAHHALTPPLGPLAESAPLRQGWEAGRACFGTRTLAPTRHVCQWLRLRLAAWRHGRAFEGVQVTPNYLRQIDATHCPITRQALTYGGGGATDAAVNRVRDDAGYAAGNLAVMSETAAAAKGRNGFDDALSLMRLDEARAPDACGLGFDAVRGVVGGGAATVPCGFRGLPSAVPDELGGLSAAEWARVAVLCSFVTDLPYAQAAGLPLLVLPPNRLRLFNPAQALQALLTRQLARPGWSARIARIEALLPGAAVRRDLQVFVNALLPRVLEGGPPAVEQAMRSKAEDAWRDPRALRCWTRFACQLSAGQAEQIVLRAGALGLGGPIARHFTLAQATEGWALAQGGCAGASHGALDAPAAAGPTPSQVPSPTRSAPVQLALCA